MISRFRRIAFLTFILAISLRGDAKTEVKKSITLPPSRTQRVAAYFHRPMADVQDLRNEGYGYGEISKILVIAGMSKRPVARLIKDNQKGYGWGTISKKYGLDVIRVKKNLLRARKNLKIRTRRPVRVRPRKY